MRGLSPSGAGRPRFTKTPRPAPEGRVVQIALDLRDTRASRKPIACTRRLLNALITRGVGFAVSGVAHRTKTRGERKTEDDMCCRRFARGNNRREGKVGWRALGDERAQKVCRRSCISSTQSLLVEGLAVGGGGRDVGVPGSLVRAGGELELVAWRP